MSSLIEDYAFLSCLETAALVHRHGSIDWCCFPRFDAPACFAGLLGRPEHGRWLVAPVSGRVTARTYQGASLILETRWQTAHGRCRVIDFMPTEQASPAIIRVVEGLSGLVAMRSELVIRFGYGRTEPVVARKDGSLVAAAAGYDALRLTTPAPVSEQDSAIVSSFEVAAGERLSFVLESTVRPTEHTVIGDPEGALRDTRDFWDRWASRCTYDGVYREAVLRSAIVLKGLTYRPTGAIVAAPTTSLPESRGGVRNWDYRYCWLRDAALTLRALVETGFTAEANEWRAWLVRVAGGDASDPQIMYGVAGERDLCESRADWLPGFDASRPVRLGNAAASQVQLDVYGAVIDAVYQGRRHHLPQSAAAWALAKRVLDSLETRWRDPDDGLWEVRGEPRHFTHSKAMSWVAFDRAVKLCEEYGLDGPVARWRGIRDEIHTAVCHEGWNDAVESFTQSFGTEAADASALMLPLLGFLPADDERIRRTVAYVERELSVDGFLRRYRSGDPVDGVPGGEGVFLACSFWMVEALALDGRTNKATALFEQLLDVANDVGLLAEQYDPDQRRLLGNFPQAFTHLALISAAVALSKSAGDRSIRYLMIGGRGE